MRARACPPNRRGVGWPRAARIADAVLVASPAGGHWAEASAAVLGMTRERNVMTMKITHSNARSEKPLDDSSDFWVQVGPHVGAAGALLLSERRVLALLRDSGGWMTTSDAVNAVRVPRAAAGMTGWTVTPCVPRLTLLEAREVINGLVFRRLLLWGRPSPAVAT